MAWGLNHQHTPLLHYMGDVIMNLSILVKYDR